MTAHDTFNPSEMTESQNRPDNIPPGIYKDLSSEDYHNDKQSLSRSSLKDFDVSPYHYWALHLNPDRPEKKRTDAMIFGSAFHTYILEPHLFKAEYAVEPEKKMLKYDGEEAYRAYKNECEALEKSDKIVLSAKDMWKLVEMKLALHRDPRTMELIRGAEIEKSFFWEDKESGLIVKSRPDILHKNMIVDLKTCSDASPRGFQNAMVSGWYHVQAGMIRDAVRELEGRDIPNCICINVESDYPFHVSIYPIAEEAIETGQREYKELLLNLKECQVKGFWPDHDIQTIGLPTWYK